MTWSSMAALHSTTGTTLSYIVYLLHSSSFFFSTFLYSTPFACTKASTPHETRSAAGVDSLPRPKYTNLQRDCTKSTTNDVKWCESAISWNMRKDTLTYFNIVSIFQVFLYLRLNKQSRGACIDIKILIHPAHRSPRRLGDLIISRLGYEAE